MVVSLEIEYYLVKLFFKLIKDYNIFFVTDKEAFYVNDIMIDPECKEIVLKYVERREE